MVDIKKIYKIDQRIACITLDFETDYGHRLNKFNILNDSVGLNKVAGIFNELEIPISAFIITEILEKYPESFDLLKKIACDFHCHSHTHNIKNFNSQYEISQSADVFKKFFGYKPLGYRAPLGVVKEGDIDIIKESGFKFSSSIFPTIRPGKFNFLKFPTQPVIYKNGLIGIPLAVVPTVRYIISLSYLKLTGLKFNKFLYSTFGLPNILIFDSHLIDFIPNEESLSDAPNFLKIAYRIHKNAGLEYFKYFINYLKSKNYRFITMTEMYEYLSTHA